MAQFGIEEYRSDASDSEDSVCIVKVRKPQKNKSKKSIVTKQTKVEQKAQVDPDDGSVDGPWRVAGLLERIKQTLTTGYWADVTVFVGDTEFKCNSLILATASQKLDLMLRKSPRELRLCDMKPHTFEQLLKIIYEEPVELKDLDTTLEVTRVANEYKIYPAELYCAARLKELTDSVNVLRIMDAAQPLQNEDLDGACKKIIRENTKEVLESAFLPCCEWSTLEAVISQDKIDVSELEMFNACVRWSRERSRPRQYLVNLLRHIRFRTMTSEEFVNNVSPTGLLTLEEENVILRCLATGKCDMPAGLSNEIRSRRKAYAGKSEEYICFLELCSGFMTPADISANEMRISLSSSMYMLGVSLNACREDKQSRTPYRQNLHVVLRNSYNKVVASATYDGQVIQWNPYDVRFERPFYMIAETVYKIQFIFANSNTKHGCYELTTQSKKTKSGAYVHVLTNVWTPADLRFILSG